MAISEHATSIASPDDAAVLNATRHVLELLFDPVNQREFAVRFWNGVVDAPPIGAPFRPSRFTVILHTPGALRRMLWPPSELKLGEAYLRGDFDVDGDLECAAGLADIVHQRLSSPRTVAHLVELLRQIPHESAHKDLHARSSGRGRIHTIKRDRSAVRAHYDVGNDFYRLWLDSQMVYSCAYFTTGDESIDAAQMQKLEILCRKLHLRPGDRLLDVGCGWGALVRYAARKYGVSALGITLSEQQAEWARQRIQEDGLTGRCRVEVRDYRELREVDRFDKIVSVGMVEHVGHAKLPEYFARMFHVLAPGGLFVNHSIVSAAERKRTSLFQRFGRKLWHQGEFIDKYVFPDGELVPLAGMIMPAEAAGFETRDVEMLREHYTRTLRHWVARLERAHAAAVDIAGEETYRVWRLFMSASAHAFATGRLNLSQIVFAKPDAAGQVDLPLTRAAWYR